MKGITGYKYSYKHSKVVKKAARAKAVPYLKVMWYVLTLSVVAYSFYYLWVNTPQHNGAGLYPSIETLNLASKPSKALTYSTTYLA